MVPVILGLFGLGGSEFIFIILLLTGLIFLIRK